MSYEPTRVTLIGRIQDVEDAAAWGEFVDLYGPMIINFCRKRGVAEHDIEDITQEVLSSMSQAIRNFDYDPEKGTFRSWLYRFVRNRLSRHWRWRERHPDRGSGRTTIQRVIENQESGDEAEQEKDWETEYQKRIFQWAAAKVREEVAEQTWQAFEMVAIENRPVEEVASALGIKSGAVYVAKSRIITRMRETVETITEGWDPDLDVV